MGATTLTHRRWRRGEEGALSIRRNSTASETWWFLEGGDRARRWSNSWQSPDTLSSVTSTWNGNAASAVRKLCRYWQRASVTQLRRGKKLSFSRTRVALLFISRFIHVNRVYTPPTEGRRVVGMKTGKCTAPDVCAILLVSGNRTRLSEWERYLLTKLNHAAE